MMYRTRATTLVSIFFLISLLTACGNFPSGQQQGVDAETPVSQQQSGRTPEETSRLFLDSWAQEDFEAMYSLISPRLLEIYSFEDFRAQYANTDSEMNFDGIDYTIHDVQLQGTSAAVTYDATIKSVTFGAIDDSGRIMRLVQEGGGWHIAWSPMDILNGMTSSVRLRSERRFPPRGNIYDRNGLPLAQDDGTPLALYLREQDMQSEEDCFDLLAIVMVRPYAYFVRLASNYLADAVFFVGELDSETYNLYRDDLDRWCGTNVTVEFFGSKIQEASGRNYYGHGALAHITGYMGSVPADLQSFWESRGYNPRDIVGLAGIENAFQDELAGRPQQFLRLIDTSSATILRELGGATGSDPVPVQLTIDRQQQMNLARAFNDAWNYSTEDWASVATGSAGVVIDVNSGAILAMFSYPTFDPRIFYPGSTYYNTNTTYAAASEQIGRAAASALNNRAVAEQYSPGSTFKIVTTLAAADSATWGRDQLFDCELTWSGRERFGDALAYREDWRVSLEEEAAGEITMSQALTTSCNPFFWEVGALMYEQNPEMLAGYAQQVGLGSPTGLVGLGFNEAAGNIPHPLEVTQALNNAIGQGDTQVTALQMARLAATIGNGGLLYRPYIVEQVGGLDNTDVIESFEPELVRTLDISPEALAVVRQGMCNVPIDREFGTSYYIFNGSDTRPSYSSCGKTGTAQTGALAPHSWYVAFAPADNPQIAIAVVVTNSREGSEVSAPIVRRFLDMYFNAPWAEFPKWWRTPYIPLTPPQGVGASSQ